MPLAAAISNPAVIKIRFMFFLPFCLSCHPDSNSRQSDILGKSIAVPAASTVAVDNTAGLSGELDIAFRAARRINSTGKSKEESANHQNAFHNVRLLSYLQNSLDDS